MIYPKFNLCLFLPVASFFFALLCPASLGAQKLEGIASFYADKFDKKPTSTGETFRQSGYSAASRDFPWGTILEVTNLSNGKTTQVRVNDCGPHAKGRIIDLSRAAARDLDFVKDGEAKVKLRVIQASEAGPTCARGAWAKKLKAQGKAIPPPPPLWDPTKTVSITPVNPVVTGPAPASPNSPVPEGSLRGMASYYPDRLQGRPTSTGEIYDGKLLTAASKDFPYGTRLEVMNIVSGQKVEVKVNDCGPNSGDRILDLSRAAAEKIDLVKSGTAVVQLRVLSLGTEGPTCNRAAWKLEQQQATNENTTVLSPPAVVPAPAKQVTVVDAYRVQVGAFGSAANADKQIEELKAKGFADVYGEGDKDLIRIYVGLLSSEKAAEALEKEVQQKGYPKATLKETKVAPDKLRDVLPSAQTAAVTTPVATPAPPAKKEFDPTDILFGVQVGAYSSKASIDKMQKELEGKGFTEVFSAKVGKMYRIFSGKFYFQSQAEVLKEKLRAAGYEDATVRRVQ